MAVKVAGKITLSPQFITKALVAKTTPQYAKQEKYGGFSYENDIYPQARSLFKDLYPTHLYNNEEFTKRFIRDFYRKDPKLQEVVSQGEIEEGQTLTGQPGEQVATEQPTPAGESAATMAGGIHLPSAPSGPVFHPIPQTPSPTPPTSESPPKQQTSIPKTRRSLLLNPQVPPVVRSLGKDLSSKSQIFVKRVGIPAITGAIGGFVGAGLTGGSSMGILGGTTLGALTPSWIKSGAGGQFLGRLGNGFINASHRFFAQATGPRFNISPKDRAKLAWALIGALFLLVFVFGVIGAPGLPTPGSEAAPIPPGQTASVDLAQCSFSGTSGTLKVGNPSLAEMVSDISAKVGVPGSVVMGILRIESVPAFISKDPNYLANDYDATRSVAGAIGIAQFIPETFIGIFNKNKAEIGEKFQKNTVIASVQPPHDPNTNDGLIRITSIKDSIVMAAYKIKDDKNARVGSTSPWDEQAVRSVARSYYGACSYEGASGSYCDDLAQSFTNCKTPSTYLADIGQIRQIVSGIQNNCSYKLGDKEIAGVVSATNLSCLNSISPTLPDPVDKHIRSNTVAYFFLQCVGYVKSLASWINNETLSDHGVANAYDYEAIPPAGYSFVPKTDNSDIILGDIAIWNNAPSGHVAYVVGVESKNRFLVTEASWGPQGYVRMDRTIDKLSEPGFRGWARKK